MRPLLANNIHTLLAADIGGTKTLLQLSYADGGLILQQHFYNHDFADFATVLRHFLSAAPPELLPISSGCLAVAAPMNAPNRVRLTNLAWEIDSDKLLAEFPISQLTLVNDFVAIGAGISELDKEDIIVLQQGEPQDKALRAVIGAGTGLGQVVLSPDERGWQVWPTEGGHTDFAPLNPEQQPLLEKLFQLYEHVSYERVLSGAGLGFLYQFVAAQQHVHPVQELSAEQISQKALQQSDPLAEKTMQLFMQLYGAQAGNLALMTLPRAGLFIAGGIAAKNLALFEQGYFMQAFLAKGRMQDVLAKIPVFLIKSVDVGLHGARLLAEKALYNGHHDR